MNIPTLDECVKEFGDRPSTRKAYYHTYLTHTDYVAAKIAEALYLGREVEDKYREVLTKRAEARAEIEKLEGGEAP